MRYAAIIVLALGFASVANGQTYEQSEQANRLAREENDIAVRASRDAAMRDARDQMSERIERMNERLEFQQAPPRRDISLDILRELNRQPVPVQTSGVAAERPVERPAFVPVTAPPPVPPTVSRHRFLVVLADGSSVRCTALNDERVYRVKAYQSKAIIAVVDLGKE